MCPIIGSIYVVLGGRVTLFAGGRTVRTASAHELEYWLCDKITVGMILCQDPI